MNENDFERYLFLHHKDEEDLTDEEFEEYENLRDIHHCYLYSFIPRPNCCEEIKNFPSVYFQVGIDGNGKWAINSDYYFIRSIHRLKQIEKGEKPKIWFENPEPKFCPFCGTKLPKMRKKKELPPNTCVVANGTHCETCSEKLTDCQCFPRAHAWEIDE